MVTPPAIDGLSSSELKQLLLRMLEQNAALQRANAELRDEIARLKGLKGRPEIEPRKQSGMDKGTEPQPEGNRASRRRRGQPGCQSNDPWV